MPYNLAGLTAGRHPKRNTALEACAIADTGLNAEICARIGRQAIYNGKLQAWAYELFFRGSDENLIGEHDPNRATGSVILSTFAEVGLNNVVGEKLAFINVGRAGLLGDLPLPVPPGRVILEVRADEYEPGELLGVMQQRRAEGFSFALDDFVYGRAVEELLDYADYAKLDYRRFGQEGMREQVKLLSAHRTKVVGMRIETQEEFNACVSLGCKNFQGHFLFRPQILRHRRLPPAFVVVSELFAKIQSGDVNFDEIDEIVRRDPALTVAVLRFLGSAAYSFKSKVKSVSQAVSLLGLVEFTKWLTLVALASTTRRPSELLLTALIRARASENLARVTGKGHPGSAFLVGLFSALGALLEEPLPNILKDLPVTGEVKEAISTMQGDLGEILTSVLARENPTLPPTSHDDSLVSNAWISAVQWAEETRRSLNLAAPSLA